VPIDNASGLSAKLVGNGTLKVIPGAPKDLLNAYHARLLIGLVDFIERYLGFSPDHGDGSFEAMLLVMLTTIIFGVALPITSKAAVANLEDVSSKSR